MTLSKGDRVSVLDEAIEGVVLSVDNNQILLETSDGFLMTYFVNEIIKINISSDLNSFISSDKLHSAMVDKQEPVKRSFVKDKKSKKAEFVLEIDLHIEKLVPNKKALSNFEILTIQTATAKRQLDFAIAKRIPKVVFIHGVGEGVLKAELDFLFARYEQISYQEANFQKYGSGATEVHILQRKLGV